MVLFPNCPCCPPSCPIESDGLGSVFIDTFQYDTDAELVAAGWLSTCFSSGYGPYKSARRFYPPTQNTRCSFFDVARNGTITVEVDSEHPPESGLPTRVGIHDGQNTFGFSVCNGRFLDILDSTAAFLFPRFIAGLINSNAFNDPENKFRPAIRHATQTVSGQEFFRASGTITTKLIVYHENGNWSAELYFAGSQVMPKTNCPTFSLSDSRFYHGFAANALVHAYRMTIAYIE